MGNKNRTIMTLRIGMWFLCFFTVLLLVPLRIMAAAEESRNESFAEGEAEIETEGEEKTEGSQDENTHDDNTTVRDTDTAAQGTDAAAQDTDADFFNLYDPTWFLDSYDFSGENAMLQSYFQMEQTDYKSLIFEMITSGQIFSTTNLLKVLVEIVEQESEELVKLFCTILLCGVLSAICRNMSGIYGTKQLWNMGQLCIYLFYGCVGLVLFENCLCIGKDTLCSITDFLNVFLPSYYITVGIAVGENSALGYYQVSLLAIYVAEYVFQLFLLPLVSIYFLFSFLSGFTANDSLQAILRIIEKIMNYVIRTAIVVIGGLGSVRMMICPVKDQLTLGGLRKILSFLPGVGNISDATMQLLGGTLLLIKNGMGAVIMVLLLVAFSLPLLRLTLYICTITFANAIVRILTNNAFLLLSGRLNTALVMLTKITGGALLMNLVVLAFVVMTKGGIY